ncbi:MAG: DUF5320 domain-containing protein [Anaerolineae bacterium]|nr:DUF5320 domain-containing protein [Anaerolineae bacterium]
MPRFDGTGPQGLGPMTGRGEGYCALVIPEPGQAPYGYAGAQGAPVRPGAPATRPALGARWLRPAARRGRGRGRGGRRGRGQRVAQW